MATPDLEDFTDLFGDEPFEIDDAGWYYGARFKVKNGEDELLVMIAPDEAQLDLVWSQGGVTRLSLSLRMVVDWLIEKRGGSEHLLVRINTGPTAICGFDYCLVRLKPKIQVDCQMSWVPGWDIRSNRSFGGELRRR